MILWKSAFRLLKTVKRNSETIISLFAFLCSTAWCSRHRCCFFSFFKSVMILIFWFFFNEWTILMILFILWFLICYYFHSFLSIIVHKNSFNNTTRSVFYRKNKKTAKRKPLDLKNYLPPASAAFLLFSFSRFSISFATLNIPPVGCSHTAHFFDFALCCNAHCSQK